MKHRPGQGCNCESCCERRKRRRLGLPTLKADMLFCSCEEDVVCASCQAYKTKRQAMYDGRLAAYRERGRIYRSRTLKRSQHA